MKRVPFRFDPVEHAYYALDTGEQLPHITGMIIDAGERGIIKRTDTRWYTEASQVRGTAVHNLTSEFDMGALALEHCVSSYKGYLAGWVAATKILGLEYERIEEPVVHPFYRYGGRPDRVHRRKRRLGVCECKSGDPEPNHEIQTALQCILVAEELGVTATSLERLAIYVKADGRYVVKEHLDRLDFNKALKVIKETCQ